MIRTKKKSILHFLLLQLFAHPCTHAHPTLLWVGKVLNKRPNHSLQHSERQSEVSREIEAKRQKVRPCRIDFFCTNQLFSRVFAPNTGSCVLPRWAKSVFLKQKWTTHQTFRSPSDQPKGQVFRKKFAQRGNSFR